MKLQHSKEKKNVTGLFFKTQTSINENLFRENMNTFNIFFLFLKVSINENLFSENINAFNIFNLKIFIGHQY